MDEHARPMRAVSAFTGGGTQMVRLVIGFVCGALLLAGCAASSKGASTESVSTTEAARSTTSTPSTTTTTEPSAQRSMEDALPTADELSYATLFASDTADARWLAGDEFVPIDADDPGCTDKLSLFEGTQRFYDYVTPAGRYAGHAYLSVLHFANARDAEEWAVAHQTRPVQTCLEEELRVYAENEEAETRPQGPVDQCQVGAARQRHAAPPPVRVRC